MASVQWCNYRGKRILLLDFSFRSPQRGEELAREAQQVVTAQDRASVRVLADFTGMKFNKETVQQIAKTLAIDRPYVRRCAWMGTENLTQEWFDTIQKISSRNIHCFPDRTTALQFLTEE